jgi:hypothetical protein
MSDRREVLHKLVNELCDAEERAAGINDEEEAAKAREEVFKQLKPLITLLARDILRERMGAARIPRLVYQTGAKHSALAVIEGNKPVPNTKDEDFADAWTNAFSRQMLICFMLDMQDILPENLGFNTAVALWDLNTGGSMPLFEPLKYKGMGKPANHHARHVHIAHVYYTMGNLNLTRKDAVDLINQKNPDGDRPMKEGTIDQWMSRSGLSAIAEFYLELGRSDAAAKTYQMPEPVGRYSPFEAEVRLNARLNRAE